MFGGKYTCSRSDIFPAKHQLYKSPTKSLRFYSVHELIAHSETASTKSPAVLSKQPIFGHMHLLCEARTRGVV